MPAASLVAVVGSALVAMASMASSGCSFANVKSPPDNKSVPMTTPCTSDKKWPWIDVAVVGAAVVAGAALLTVAKDSCDHGSCSDIGLLAIPALGFGISAIVGFDRVDRCRRRLASPAERSANSRR